MTSDLITVVPLGGTLGARVTGLDLSSVDEALGATLSELLDEHLMLLIDDADLDNEAIKAVIDLLGTPYMHPLGVVAGATDPQPHAIVDDADHPPYQDLWHTDVTWDPVPPAYGSLLCVEMPAAGGDTMWANMHAVHDALSETFRQSLGSLNALHDMGRGTAFETKGGVELTSRTRELYPGVERPVINHHPRTGRPYVDVNRGFTNHIVGMADDESRMLLDYLFELTSEPRFHYRHVWTEGEFVIWDERATQHNAVADHYPQRREMTRYCVS